MALEFLEHLNLSVEERKKLRSLGARTPAALLAMRRASPAAFDAFLGHDRAEEIAAELAATLTEQEKEQLAEPVSRSLPTGARVDKQAPEVPKPPYGLAQRDRLFAELQNLRQRPKRSAKVSKRIAELERQLAELLKTS